MNYFSTNNKNLRYSFKEAVLKGLAPDKGLFFPLSIPKLNADFFKKLPGLSLPEIGYEVGRHFVGNDLSDTELHQITTDAFHFPVPLVPVEDGIYALELFHGPTCAFKDIGARFMSRCVNAFARQNQKEINILVATSGDTGSAVANGFLGVEGVNVIILYPSGKVSTIQEQQLTTMGQNITALEIKGSFDDCQKLVKTAFADKDLNRSMTLSSANSINIARLLPQSFYYFYAWAQLQANDKKVMFSIPSGNYGNLTGGLLAKKMGLPVNFFVAASNQNKIIPDYLQSGTYEPKESVQTISNAMDVGNPSNFARIIELYKGNYKQIVKDIKGTWQSDQSTKEAIQKLYLKTGYILDPHGAIGYLGVKEYLNDADLGIFLETAHPAKFRDAVQEIIQCNVEIPAHLQIALQKEKQSIVLEKNFENLKEFLLSN